MGSSRPRDYTQIPCVSCTVGRFLTTEPPGKPNVNATLSVCPPSSSLCVRKSSLYICISIPALQGAQSLNDWATGKALATLLLALLFTLFIDPHSISFLEVP